MKNDLITMKVLYHEMNQLVEKEVREIGKGRQFDDHVREELLVLLLLSTNALTSCDLGCPPEKV